MSWARRSAASGAALRPAERKYPIAAHVVVAEERDEVVRGRSRSCRGRPGRRATRGSLPPPTPAAYGITDCWNEKSSTLGSNPRRTYVLVAAVIEHLAEEHEVADARLPGSLDHRGYEGAQKPVVHVAGGVEPESVQPVRPDPLGIHLA